MGKVAEQVRELVEPIADSFGLEVLEVLYEKKYDGMNLTVVIDKDGGVTIDDCEKLHRAIDGPLDELDPIDDCEKLHRAIDGPLDELDPIDVSYTLNVSSPGLDRPLKLERDYKRNLGKKISVKLYSPLNGKKVYSGVLTAYGENSFTIRTEDGKENNFEKKDAAKVEPIIEF